MSMSGAREICSEFALPDQHDAAAGERQPCSNEHHAAVEEISPQRSVSLTFEALNTIEECENVPQQHDCLENEGLSTRLTSQRQTEAYGWIASSDIEGEGRSEIMKMTPVQKAAKRYAKRGFSVIALKPNEKTPAIRKVAPYMHQVPTKEERRAMFAGGDKNLGIVCGSVSGRFAVLDIDDPLLAYQMAGDDHLRTMTTRVRTRSSGLHVYMYETDATSRGGPLVPRVADLKAEGGYVVAPPSSINGKRYKTLRDDTIMEVPDAREWSIETLKRFGVEVADRSLDKSLKPSNVIAKIRPGNRHDSCFRLACKLRSDGYQMDDIAALVRPLARESGLPDAETETMLGSVAQYPAGVDAVASGTHALKGEWPEDASEEAFYGLAGDIARTLESESEADPHALLANILTIFGVLIGPRPHFTVGGDRHALRLFTALVGETSRGRKGLSHSESMAVFKHADSDISERVTSGLSTGEGLIHSVRDPITRHEAVRKEGRVVDYQDVIIDEGVEDKRLLVVETEFARVLRVMGREGNTLSAVMRQAWDTGDLRVLTRKSPAVATGAHIGILAHITPQELLGSLDRTDAANGWANRIIWVATQRSKLLPDGGRLPVKERKQLARRLRKALKFARTVDEIRRDPEARDLWHEVYEELSEGRPGLFGAMTGRAEAQVTRLACLYALMDFKEAVGVAHLQAALEFWKRVEQTVRHVFGDATGDPAADTILRALRAQERMSQTEISNLFRRNKSSRVIARALSVLAEARMVTIETVDADNGRLTTYWIAT